ncbi:MAG: hypothetical protein ABFD54_14675 [Armatimonadota bacterium]|nr:hypothetical protein [bacterium]
MPHNSGAAVGIAVILAIVMLASPVCADMYAASWSGPGVGWFNSAGTYVKTLDGQPTGTQLAFGPDGDLYAMFAGFGGCVRRYNTVTGAVKGVVFTADPDDYISAMAFGPDRDLYVSYTCVDGDFGHRKIAHLSGPAADDPFVAQSPLIDSVWPLYGPYTMTFGPDGDLYISDGMLLTIQRWGGPSQPNLFKGDFIAGTTGMAVFGPDNNLYVGTNRYQGPYGQNPGQLIGQFIDLSGSGLTKVVSLAFNQVDGDVYAHDGSVVARFNGPDKLNAGKYVSTFATISSTEINSPRQIVFTPISPTPSLGMSNAKSLPSYSMVKIDDLVVTARFMGDTGSIIGFSIEHPERTSGVRVISTASVLRGYKVSVQGRAVTLDGERVIDTSGPDSSVTIISKGNTAASPLYLNNKAVCGGAFGAQPAVVDNAPDTLSTGLNTVGLYAKIFGRVTYVANTGNYSGYFYLDDGSGLWDGSVDASGAPISGVRCRPAQAFNGLPGPMPQENTYVTALGVVGVQKVNGHNARYFWTVSWKAL